MVGEMATDRLGALRLAGRALWERRGQTLLIVLIGALVSGTVVFAAGYQRQVQETVVDATFAANGPGSAWMLRGSPEADLTAALPDGWDALFEPPVAGQVAAASWVTPRYPLGIGGALTWRADICAHLLFTGGRCPTGTDQVAVSAADAERYEIRVGQRVGLQSSISKPVPVTVVGIYRPKAEGEGYWFGNPPVGSSGFVNDEPRSNPLITVGNVGDDVPGAQHTLDLRLDRAVADVATLPEIEAATTILAATAPREEIVLTTAIPVSLAHIAAERARTVTGLALTLVQLAALIVVVLVLLASVAITSQRGELGLARLRGQAGRRAGRQVVGRWALAVALGWLLGWVPALVALFFTATGLPGQRGLRLVPVVPIAAGAALLLMVAAIVPATRAMVRQPVVELLRTSPPAAAESGRRELIVDVAVLAAAASGLVVALQSGTSSLLGLLVPSLLAIAVGIVLGRIARRLADRVRARRLRTGRAPGALLTAILLSRLRGQRLTIVTVCLASAFAVFAVQVQAIGTAVRRHEAGVRTGAAAVLTVDGDPSALVAALDQLDPAHATDRATMTAVVLTRRADAGATRGMYVEPAAFDALAYGADQAADRSVWQAIAAPSTRPVDLVGENVTMTIGAHGRLGETDPDDPTRVGGRAELGIGYLDARGGRRTLALGSVSLAAAGPQTLRRDIDCAAGCRLLQLTVAPDGPVRGELPLTAMSAGGHRLDLGSAGDWVQPPGVGPGAEVVARPSVAGLVLAIDSGGGTVALQQAWAPTVLPVLAAEDVRLGVDPTIAAPDGTAVRVESVARARDAIPRALAGVVVGDLESARRNGYATATPETSVQVWLSAATADRVAAICAGLADRGLPVIQVDRVQSALAAQRLTAAALTGVVAPAFAVLALIFGGLAIALTAAGQQGVLGRDLAALRLAGVGDRVLRRSVLRTYVWPVVVAALAGTAIGVLGCLLVADALPVLPDRSPAIHPDLDPRPVALALSALGCLVVLVGTATFCAVRVVAGSSADRLRSRR